MTPQDEKSREQSRLFSSCAPDDLVAMPFNIR
jgi:hypothetical protein